MDNNIKNDQLAYGEPMIHISRRKLANLVCAIERQRHMYEHKPDNSAELLEEVNKAWHEGVALLGHQKSQEEESYNPYRERTITECDYQMLMSLKAERDKLKQELEEMKTSPACEPCECPQEREVTPEELEEEKRQRLKYLKAGFLRDVLEYDLLPEEAINELFNKLFVNGKIAFISER